MTRKIKIERPLSPLSWFESLLRGQRRNLLTRPLQQAARLGSWGYEIGIRGREAAYQKGLLRVQRLPRPTVCIGNITVGGTGKTPLVMRLVQDLLARGVRPAVLLRGYKRQNRAQASLIVRGPEKIRATVDESGDEAMELARRLPGACVGVGANRHATGMLLLKHFPIDCFIMDDGFQHYQLYRDVNVVTLDVTDPWGGGKLLPAGYLRESPEALQRADLVILTRVGMVSPDRLAVLRAEVATLTREGTGILESRHEPRALVSLKNQKALALSELKSRAIVALSGIAHPDSFESSLVALGADVRSRVRFGDHQGRASEVWAWVAKHHRKGQWIVMTEKDAVRWGGNEAPLDLISQSYALRMDLVLGAGRGLWQKLLKRLASK